MKKKLIILFSVVLGSVVGASAVGMILSRVFTKEINEKEESRKKFRIYYDVLNQWLSLKQNGESLTKYFKEHQFSNIAIYGMGELGKRLIIELENSGVNVVFAIDKDAKCINSEIDVYEVDDKLPEADVMVVSSVFAFDTIKKELSSKLKCPIISLEDIIYEL